MSTNQNPASSNGNQKRPSAATPQPYPKWFGENVDHILKDAVATLEHGWHFDSATAWDVALETLEYSLRPAISGQAPYPATVGHLRALMAVNLKRRATDCYRRQHRQPQMVDIDETWTGEDGVEHESAALEKLSVANFYAQQDRHDDLIDAHCLDVDFLDKIFDKLNLRKLDRDVFTEACLKNRPRKEVAEQYGITANNCSVILGRVKEKLARLGPPCRKAVCLPRNYSLAA